MIEKLRAELLPLADQFQIAGADGLRRVLAATQVYDGDQWEFRRLQRDPYLHGLRRVLPKSLGSFVREDDLYAQNRLLYRSETHEADLVFRRRGSLTAYKSKREDTEPGLFPTPERVFLPNPDTQSRQIACIWDLPRLDESHEAIGAFPFIIRIAKQNTLLGQGHWDGGFPLIPVDGIMPSTAEFDMDSPDWDVDDDEEAEGQ
ncbi:MAG: hypothetical protein Q4G50_12685 [Corynebacterium sp.]|uniref:hypothetical protein n=1 Tax=Corynebacterium sp. TaxID=1720 RepID=UPI0026E08B2A|nr:hypothetical protein [Corynebacterium sp.]MDO5670841.1 hypothetical protein [Corynebacterium sp.]